MASTEWREALVTGDAVIDSQHRTLFKMIDELHEALLKQRSKEITDALLDALERYVVYHFNVERHLMDSSGYPAMRAHIKLHDDIVARAKETVQSYRTNGIAMGVTVTQALARVLVEHIVNEDKKLVQWSRLNGARPAASGHFPTQALPKVTKDHFLPEPTRESSTQKSSSGNWTARDSLRQLVAASDARTKK